jgi:hypothetical protein
MKPVILLFFLITSFFLGSCSEQSAPPFISGRITVAPSLASKMGPSDAVFIMALPREGSRDNSTNKKPETAPARSTIAPVAVKKIAPAIFPLDYKLSQDDVIFPDKRFDGDLFIMARIDKNGEAFKEKGDLEGVYKKNPVRVGTKRVDIVIDQEVGTRDRR